MSKFTKALEKIQQKKEAEAQPKVAKDEVASWAKIEESKTNGSSNGSGVDWSRGITSARNSLPDQHIVTHHFTDSLIAEQYRTLRINLKTHLSEGRFADIKGAKVILVSSAIHGEGKSVTATNLSMALAEDPDAKIALIDGDLRRGKIAEYMGFGKGRPGLSDYLISTNGLAPKKVMLRNGTENLVVMPCGPHAQNASRLISSEKLRFLIAEMRNHFDYIIVDAPPILPVADATALGRETDGVLLVIQAGKTPKSMVSHANVLFAQAGVPVMGYVLTNVEYASPAYQHYSSYYAHNHYDDKPHGKNRAWYRFQLQANILGNQFHKLEERFNRWWDKRFSKKDG